MKLITITLTLDQFTTLTSYAYVAADDRMEWARKGDGVESEEDQAEVIAECKAVFELIGELETQVGA
jgi:hypothetical protein